jgi:O-antigen/teichoic acid export membrane protein
MINHEKHAATVVSGMSWMTLNTIVSRVIVLLSQLLLGYLLNPTDFGVYALALSVTNSLSAVRNGGTSQLMITRGIEYERTLVPVTQYSLIFNVAALLILFAVAPLASAAKKISDIGWLIIAIALSFPIGTFATVFRTELSIQGRFREVAILNALSTGLWQLEAIVLAALGFGAYSFAIPMVLQSVVDGILGWRYVRNWPLRGPMIGWAQFLALFRETRWIMLGLVMLSLGLSGHFFAAGLFVDPATVGTFFFGFQLAYTLFIILNNSIETVLPPMLAHLNEHRDQQSRTTIDMLRMLMIVSLPMAGAVALSAHAAIHLLWHGKWDQSAGVVSIMVVSIPAWVGIAIVRAVLEARGLWMLRLGLLSIYGIGTFVVVAAAATTKNLNVISGCLSAFYVVYSLALLALLPLLTGAALADVLGAFVMPLVVCVVCAAIAWFSIHALPVKMPEILRGLFETLAFSLGALVCNWILFRKVWVSALGMLYRRGPQIA